MYDSSSGVVSALPGFVITGPTESLIVSEDFTAVYFNSAAALTPEAGVAVPGGALNVYRYDLVGLSLRFVVNGGSREESVSPDGRFLFFGAGEGGAERVEGLPSVSQVYRYDDALGVVECVSCASSFNPEPALKATFVGEPPTAKGADGVPSPFVASADGRFVFFDTPSALVPQDIDGERHVEGTTGELPSLYYSPSSDVYEWRGDGVDGCVLVGGCVSLVSGGTGGYLVQLLGTTPSGGDVFFATHELLSSGDLDSAGDVYDARVNGGPPPSRSGLVPCEGDSCSSPVVAPFDSTPASFAFAGPENPGVSKGKPERVVRKRCRRGFVLKKGRCVKAHRARRASHGGHRTHRSAGGVK
jgi:hypothetical protein